MKKNAKLVNFIRFRLIPACFPVMQGYRSNIEMFTDEILPVTAVFNNFFEFFGKSHVFHSLTCFNRLCLKI